MFSSRTAGAGAVRIRLSKAAELTSASENAHRRTMGVIDQSQKTRDV
jgi:hypothetical protein